MNLLVTNTRNAQAYAIIRALRPYARKIVVTMYGKTRFTARFSHAAHSRLVDKRYCVPSPVEDWRAGNIQRENTEREEAYIRAVLRICEVEQIDTIFPSWDPKVYVFSKNKERFEKIGVLIPVPHYETVLVPLDKYRTIQAAQEVGFPCPRTHLPESENDLPRISEELGFPLVIKPRFTSAGRGMQIVTDFSQLSERIRHLNEAEGMPMVQEYIPGKQRLDFNLLLDKKGELKFGFCGKELRNFLRLNTNLPTATESMAPHPYLPSAAGFVRKLGWWGAADVETKIDVRDGLPKLMEINPRLGRRLWRRTHLGINEPLMCIRIAKGEEVETVKDYPVGTVLLDPIDDLTGLCLGLIDLLIYRFRIGVQGKAPLDPLNPPMHLRELIRSYKDTYFGAKPRAFNPYFRYFFQEPLVSILWWLQFASIGLRAANQLGR